MNAPRKRHAIAYGGLLCGLGTLLVLAACEAKIPTSAEIAQMDVASAEKSAAEVGYMRTPANDRTDFFLNGVPVSAERARAIEAKDIGSIEIVRSELPTGRDTIFVTSADRMKRPATTADSLEAARFGGSEYSFQRKKIAEASGEKLVAHVEAERAAERMRTADGALMLKTPLPPEPLRMKVRGGDPPIILIDGKRATEAQLAALDEKNIAAMAIYKDRERLHLSRDQKEELRVTSDPSGVPKVTDGGAVISVTTKMAKARAQKP